MILGLDISTSCTGWCILNSSGELVKMGYIPLAKIKSMFKKAQTVRHMLSSLNVDYDIERIYIEENLQAFRPGLSSAKTLLSLARFNGIISYIAQEEFFISPEFINVNAARKKLSIKIKRKKNGGKPTKEQVLDWVTSQIASYTWPKKQLKSGPRKGKLILEPGCYDMADSYVIARAGILN
jgi:Holliday junction resolvasome RuvABC endonuclease subunit